MRFIFTAVKWQKGSNLTRTVCKDEFEALQAKAEIGGCAANGTASIFLLCVDGDAEGEADDGAGVDTRAAGGWESRRPRAAAHSNSVPVRITVGSPLFILQQGQRPLHVALPAVCSTGGDFQTIALTGPSHRHQRAATQHKFESVLKIRATAQRPSAVQGHAQIFVGDSFAYRACQIAWFFLNSRDIWTLEVQIPRLSSHSATAPVLEWFQQELGFAPSTRCFFKMVSFIKLWVYLCRQHSMCWDVMLGSGTFIQKNLPLQSYRCSQQFTSLKTHSLQ